jgi:hypothetical protein
MKKFYSIIIMVLVFTLLTSTTAFASSAKSNIKVTVNNKTVQYNIKPYMIGKDIMVPLQQTAEAFGAKVTWDKKSKTAWVDLDLMHIEIPVGKKEIYIHRDADFSGIPQVVKLNTPIRRVKSKIVVPAIEFFGSMGMSVTWNREKRILTISSIPLSDCDLLKEIPYTVITKDNISNIKEVSKWYSKNYKKAGVNYFRYKDTMYVLVGAGSRPTGGYTVAINKISYDSKTSAYVTGSVKKPSPDMMVTQVETFPSVLIKIEGQKNLKTVKGKVSEIIVDTIPSEVVYEKIPADFVKGNESLMTWYNENNMKPGISYKRDGEYVYVLIGAGEKPSGGYTIQIDNIFYSSVDTVSINARVNPPGDNVRVMMMITYPSTLIRFKSDTVKTVIGDIINATPSDKDKWITMDSTTVSKMELYSLDNVKIKDITGSDKEAIMSSFTESIIDPNPYVKMIAGNVLKVTMNDGYILTFTSYGSKTNVIVNFNKGDDTRTYHLVAPAIAEILLRAN